MGCFASKAKVKSSTGELQNENEKNKVGKSMRFVRQLSLQGAANLNFDFDQQEHAPANKPPAPSVSAAVFPCQSSIQGIKVNTNIDCLPVRENDNLTSSTRTTLPQFRPSIACFPAMGTKSISYNRVTMAKVSRNAPELVNLSLGH